MKTAKEYASEYRQIASNLGYQGDSVELLVQMLAHFTYTNEVENIATTLEGSLERALQDNSKIQLCVEQMYSVFRGRCPRVLLKFRPTKFFEFSLYDKVYSGNNFSLYYLGYLPSSGDDTGNTSGALEVSQGSTGSLEFTYAPVTIAPSDSGYCTIVCLLAKESIERSWTMSSTNPYYVDILEEDLSSDLWLQTGHLGSTDSLEYLDTTREFQKHLLDSYAYDLTLPGWSLRIYLPESYRTTSTTVKAGVFKMCSLDDFNSYDLQNIKVTGGELLDFTGLTSDLSQTSTGVIVIPEISHEDLSVIHYKANQDRYMGSVLRSNSDVGDLLKEMYPLKVSGTSYKFTNSPEIVTTKTVETLFEGEVLQDNINSYVLGSNSNLHDDFDIDPDTTESIVVNVDTTNSEDPRTYTYSIRTESPISQLGVSLNAYVLKTYKDSEGDIVSEVLSDLDSEDLILSYRYSTSSEWTTLDPGSMTIPSRAIKSQETDSETTTSSTEKSSGTSTTTTTTTDEEGNVSTVVTETVSSDTSESTGTGSSNTSTQDSSTTEPESTEPLRLRLWSTSLNEVVDLEIIPYIDSDSTYFGLTDRNYTVPLSRTLEPLISFPQKIPTVLFNAGVSEVADSYEIISHSKELGVSIGSDGVLSIDSFKSKSIGTYSAVIAATIGNLQYTTTLTVDTTATTDSVPRVLQLYRKLDTGTYTLLKTYDVLDSSVIEITDIQDLLGSVDSDQDGIITLALDCNKSSSTSSDTTDTIEPVLTSTITSARSLRALATSSAKSASLSNVYTRSSVTTDSITNYKQITLKNVEVHKSIETAESVQSRSEFKPELVIYYIPQSSSELLSDAEKSDFIDSRSSYYITNNISIERGTMYNVTLDLNVLLYQNTSIDSEVTKITDKFKGQFGLDLDSIEDDLRAQISKISNVAKIKSLKLSWRTESGESVDISSGTIDSKTSYLDIVSFISTDLV